ncbi:MAG: Hsp20/alpha crystallin family protein [Massilia sp.]|jgi:HSP20 family protein|nr:Hsp20/alpha crystallin family protein [Massilia sp.]
MANSLTRLDPFSELARLDPFRGLGEIFNQSLTGPGLSNLGMTPRMDVIENDQAYIVRAEIPGVKKDDIKVNVDGNQVTISAQIEQESQQQQGRNLLFTERTWGQYYRSFTLPQPVDDTQANAEYHDGILELTLPKKTGGSAKTLTVH